MNDSPFGKTAVFVLATLITSLWACSAPGSELVDSPIVEEMEEGRQDGEKTFDHDSFEKLLEEHVVIEDGGVDYEGLAEDKEELEAYLDELAAADMTKLDGDEQLAFLINAYNAYTLSLILERYPDIESIRDISKPWSKPKFEVAEHKLSLDDIEHGLIRPVFKDPRIHFAVNCAAKDCPPLRPFAYKGDEIDEQIEEVTRDVLRSERFVLVEDQTLHLTRLFEWYGDDFVDADFKGHASNHAAYVAQFADNDVRAFVEERDGDPKVEFLEYDWDLNEAK